MGSRFSVAALVLGALVLPGACRGESTTSSEGSGGGSGTRGSDGGTAGGGGSGGSSGRTMLGGTTSSGGNAARAGMSAAGGGGSGSPSDKGGGTSTSGAAGDPASSGRGGTATAGASTGGGQSHEGGAAGSSATDGDAGEAGDRGNANCVANGNRTLNPDASGWVDADAPCNDVGVQGAWAVYGDAYGQATCITVGLHEPEECSRVTTPDPFGAFSNVLGEMHTIGTIAQILPCPSGLTTSGCPEHDYSNMWGISIGLDFNVLPAEDGGKHEVWDPAERGVIGVAFSIDQVPLAGLRVEFPMLLTDAEAGADSPPLPSGSTTESHSFRSPFWGAQRKGDQKFPDSPVYPGVNRILWADVQPPKLSAYVFDTRRLLGIRFHVLASTTATAFDFTVSNLTFLRQ